MMSRTKEFLDKLKEEHFGMSIVIVGHGGINLAIIANLLSITPEEVIKYGKLDNTSITVFDSELKIFNCINHLED